MQFLKADNDRLPASQNGCGVRDTTGRLFGVSDFNIRCRCRLPFYNNSIVDVLLLLFTKKTACQAIVLCVEPNVLLLLSP
ncbi:hypothetical protein T4A_4123 [Trichinella pseudospiralis]|uniref:Uncharacterized protein n=1 Tax=Trichinella pseudospiralis TaxID=6337 RepID=A0A0V1E4Y8_TRIPS|nr:hypothetical protein T4A_4123 [Trichinella pseudospiralis]